MTPTDKNLAAYSQAVARSWRDPGYRKELVADPGKVLREAGMELPENVQIKALQDTAQLTHLVLPAGAHESEAALRQMAASLGHQVKVVHNSEGLMHVPIPHPPEGFQADAASSALSAIAGGQFAHIMRDINVSVSVSVSVVAAAVVVATASLS